MEIEASSDARFVLGTFSYLECCCALERLFGEGWEAPEILARAAIRELETLGPQLNAGLEQDRLLSMALLREALGSSSQTDDLEPEHPAAIAARKAYGQRLAAWGDNDAIEAVAYFWMNGTTGGPALIANAKIRLMAMGRQNDPDDEKERLALIDILTNAS